jgi:hypothetical protein
MFLILKLEINRLNNHVIHFQLLRWYLVLIRSNVKLVALIGFKIRMSSRSIVIFKYKFTFQLIVCRAL